MLAATRDVVVADVLFGAREIRYMELENIVSRYTSILTVMSMSGGFAFTAMVELDLEDADSQSAEYAMGANIFYISTSLALSAAIYALFVGTYAVATGYRLAMVGGLQGSGDRAVYVLKSKLPKVFGAALLSGVSIVVSAAVAIYLKLNNEAVTTFTSTVLFVCFVATAYEMFSTSVQLQLGRSEDGKVRLEDEDGRGIDVGNLELPSSLHRAI